MGSEKLYPNIGYFCLHFSLRNLLGSHPEMCEPWSRITAAYDKGFLILEVTSLRDPLIMIILLNVIFAVLKQFKQNLKSQIVQ